jgi:N-acetylglutamate synthase-like GNAT family acetyltransferase
MKRQVEEKMLGALELFYYSYRFRRSLFVLLFDEAVGIDNVLTDLRVLHSSQIRVALFCWHAKTVAQEVELWNQRGGSYRYFQAQVQPLEDSELMSGVSTCLEQGVTPVIGIDPASTSNRRVSMIEQGAAFADDLEADKLFYLSEYSGLEVDSIFHSHPLPEEIEGFLTEGLSINIGRELLELLNQQQKNLGLEIVLLDGKSGSLFQEIFTHRGKGTLFSSNYPNVMRPARLSDVEDVCILMRPYMHEGTVLPVSDEEIGDDIESFYVYTVNEAVVASARLKSYGDYAELGKFCTLPRYQGRGRARQLARHLIEVAREQGRTHLFALSTLPRMWVFFSKLGFEPCERENLPEEWARHYDFDRPSRALLLKL